MVREIQNLCRNNQMRDVFFEEVECDDPENYVRAMFRDKQIQLTSDRRADGSVAVYVGCDGLNQKFIFTPV